MLQERYALSPPGVDYATFDGGSSSLRSGQLVIGGQATIQHRGISLVFVKEII